MRTFPFFLAILAPFSVGAFGSPALAAAQDADIVGTWVLNRDKSDDPRAVMTRSRRRPPREDPTAGGENARRRRRGQRPQTRSRPGEGDRLLRRRLMSPIPNLVITKSDSTYVFATKGRRFSEHFFDGRKIKSMLGPELEIEIKAEWKKNMLVIETKTTGGAKLKEKYEIDQETGELRVEFDFSNRRFDQRVRIKRIYEREREG
ncbi:MAG: hypothetical protein BMS9Abin29_0226 [Gemmatimonadota bacterium]|nr:MAG: hypothetical protein BMS9Abin29_0226 [Gemmatimonadota bacterium]